MTNHFRHIADTVSHWLGTPVAVGLTLLVAACSVAGYTFGYLGDARLVLVTLILSYYTQITAQLLQASQSKGDIATHAKLDALIEAGNASNRFLGLESCTDDELQAACEWLKERRENRG